MRRNLHTWAVLSVAVCISCTRGTSSGSGEKGRCAEFAPGVWAIDDTAVVPEDTPTTIDVLANDCGVGESRERAELTIAAVTAGEIGSVQIVGSVMLYVPKTNAFGVDAVSYRIHTADGATGTGTVYITVHSINDNPTAADDYAELLVGDTATLDVLANDSDVEGHAIRLVDVETPAHGDASVEDEQIVYTSAESFVGEDRFSYTVMDSAGGAATAEIIVTIIPVPDDPITPPGPGEPVRLSPQYDVGQDVHQFKLSDDSGYVVYTADENSPNVLELYTSRLDTHDANKSSAPWLLSDLAVATDVPGITSFSITSDSTHVAYQRRNSADVETLHGTSIEAPAPVKVGPDGIISHKLQPSGHTVAYIFAPGGGHRLGVAQLDNADSRVIGGIAGANEAVREITFSSNGGHIGFITYDASRRSMYLMPSAASSATCLPTACSEQGIWNMRFAPDGQGIAAIIDWSTNNGHYLAGMLVDGANSLALTSKHMPGTLDLWGFRYTPSGDRLLYWGDIRSDNVGELYSVTATGGSRVRLSVDIGGSSDLKSLSVSADSVWTVYQIDALRDEHNDLYAVPTDGTLGNVLLTAPESSGAGVSRQSIHGPSERVLFLSQEADAGPVALYSVTLAGTDLRRLSQADALSDVTMYHGNPVDSRVVFSVILDQPDQAELFIVDVTGGEITRLNTDLPQGGTVFPDFAVTRDGTRVIYRATQRTVTEIELFSVAL